MADYTLHEGFPNIRIVEGMKFRLNAIDPTTGAEVSGVTSSLWSIYGDDDSDEPPEPDQPTEWLEIPA